MKPKIWRQAKKLVKIKLMQGEFDPQIIKDAYSTLIEQGHNTDELIGFSNSMY